MKIYCDYCGTQIDTEKNITCPNCGAAYANDLEIKLAQEQEQRQQVLGDLDSRIKIMREQQIMKEFEQHRKESNLAVIGKIIVGGLSLCLAIYVMIRVGAALA